jgi:hypothetical protein
VQALFDADGAAPQRQATRLLAIVTQSAFSRTFDTAGEFVWGVWNRGFPFPANPMPSKFRPIDRQRNSPTVSKSAGEPFLRAQFHHRPTASPGGETIPARAPRVPRPRRPRRRWSPPRPAASPACRPDVAPPARGPLGAVEAMLAAHLGCLRGPAVDAPGAGGRLPPCLPPHLPTKDVVDGPPGAVPFPPLEIVGHGLPGGKSWGNAHHVQPLRLR